MRGSFVSSTLLLSALAAAPARAQSPDDARIRADALFREGQDLMTAGQFPTACARLEESHRLDPKIGRLLNLAYCHEQLGRTATAWAEYNQAAALALQTKQSERESFARKQAGVLARKLSFLQLDLRAAPEVSQVAVDGGSLSREQWSVPFPVDPGDHSLSFGAAGRKARTQIVAASAPGTIRVTVEALEPEAGAPAPTDVPAGASPSPTGSSPQPEPPPSQFPQAEGPLSPAPRVSRAPGWIVGGVGVAAIGMGTAFGVRAITLKNDADPQCPNHRCTTQGFKDIGDAKTAATISTIGLAAGAVGIAAGAWLILRVAPAAASAELVPYVAADRAGLAWQGAW